MQVFVSFFDHLLIHEWESGGAMRPRRAKALRPLNPVLVPGFSRSL